MSHKSLKAGFWLMKSSASQPIQANGTSALSSEAYGEDSPFNPKKFFVQGWQGDSLGSKEVRITQKALDITLEEAFIQLSSCDQFTSSIRQALYDEFLHFANESGFHFNDLESVDRFWFHFRSPQSPYKADMVKFKRLYAAKVSVIYFLKVQFLLQLTEGLGRTLSLRDFQNPSSMFTKIFKSRGSTELKALSLKANPFSWFRPGSRSVDFYYKKSKEIESVKLGNVLKLIGLHLEKVEIKSQFSHSLSHAHFGKFLEYLLIDFPNWTKGSCAFYKKLEVLTTKIYGDKIHSFPSALWKSNYFDKVGKSRPLISPSFQSEDSSHGDFLHLVSELQFMSLLIKLSEQRSLSPVQLICQVINQSYNKTLKPESHGQISMFPEGDVPGEPTYERVILNLEHFPKNNPHFYLLNKINSQVEALKEEGFLYVFSTKKLFVPSQSEKVEQLLKKVKLEAAFTLNDLKGKGEIGSFLYIFSKASFFKRGNELPDTPTSDLLRHPCLSFRFRGELNTFHEFNLFLEEMKNFFSSKSKDSTPLYQKEIGEQLIFEYFKDAIVDGRLINSTSKDPSSITHPNFFKNLLASSLPLGHYFSIDPLNNEQTVKKKGPLSGEWLGLNFRGHNSYSAILIVDHRQSESVRLEIIDPAAYKAKTEEYGVALCQYFGLTPKIKEININLFREFFHSDIGNQIVQLCLSGGQQKTKARLQALLIPKFFLKAEKFPEQLAPLVSLLNLSRDEILKLSSEDLKSQFHALEGEIDQLTVKFPWRMISLLGHFKNQLQLCSATISNLSGSQIINIFNSPGFIQELTQLPCQPLYPGHNDFYIEFNHIHKSDIDSPPHFMETKLLEKNGTKSWYLEISTEDKVVLRIFSSRDFLNFLKFILNGIQGVGIRDLLQSLELPSLEDFEQLLAKYNSLSDTLVEIEEQCSHHITTQIRKQIFNPTKGSYPLA